jgi:hypothetical protein
LGHSPKVAAEHYLMSREHHFEDVVGGGRGPTAAERSSWVFGVLVGGVEVRRDVLWPVVGSVMVAFDIGGGFVMDDYVMAKRV